jgi:hypothetical protein
VDDLGLGVKDENQERMAIFLEDGCAPRNEKISLGVSANPI